MIFESTNITEMGAYWLLIILEWYLLKCNYTINKNFDIYWYPSTTILPLQAALHHHNRLSIVFNISPGLMFDPTRTKHCTVDCKSIFKWEYSQNTKLCQKRKTLLDFALKPYLPLSITIPMFVCLLFHHSVLNTAQ